MIRQIELTSKLMLVVIAAVAFSAIAIPTYAIRITSADIVDGEVKTADIANNAVTTVKIQDGQVNNLDIANSAVTASKIKTGVIESGHIKDGTIQAADIAEGVIPSSSSGTIPADDSVTSAKIMDGEVKSADIQDGTIQAADIAADAIVLNTYSVSQNFQVAPGGDGPFMVSCPNNDPVTGGGYTGGGTTGSFFDVWASQPFGSETWRVEAVNEESYAANLLVFAVCLDQQ